MTDTSDMVRLATWLSPAFPIGAFSYSHGLEAMVNSGRIRCSQDLAQWLDDLLRLGSAWSDAVLFAEAWNAARDGDDDRLAEAAELGEALAPSAERLAETMEQGTAFLKGAGAWAPAPMSLASHPHSSCQRRLASNRNAPTVPNDVLDPSLRWGDGMRGESIRLDSLSARPHRAPYPVAVAAVCADHGIACELALAAYLHAFAANQVSAAIRLVPLGQSDGLAVLAQLEPVVLDVAARAARSSLDDLGSATIMADIASMTHETDHSRLFRS